MQATGNPIRCLREATNCRDIWTADSYRASRYLLGTVAAQNLLNEKQAWDAFEDGFSLSGIRVWQPTPFIYLLQSRQKQVWEDMKMFMKLWASVSMKQSAVGNRSARTLEFTTAFRPK